MRKRNVAMNSWDLTSQVRQRLREEAGTLRTEAPLRVALCYPSQYPVGMSSLGFQTIYREIHLHPGAGAERAFLPDNAEDYRRLRVPLFTYESETPVANFPVVAFSISYELEITGLLELLDLSGIPLRREDRTGRYPLIVVGGPLTFSNPLPLAPFVDLILLGEAEELIHTFLDAVSSMSRAELLSRFAALPGCYVPGQSKGLPLIARTHEDCLPAQSQIITRNAVLSSMFLIEPERGCSRTCTFCVMRGTTNGGMRLVAPEKVLALIPGDARRVGLVGAAVTDHPRITDLVGDIVRGGREIGISSLRADRLSEELMGLLCRGGYRTLTTAADGVSQRLRDSVQRRTNEQHLIRAAGLARKYHLERMKLYEIIGLPGETLDDIDELVRLSLDLARIAPLSLAISPFVAKRNTPLDGAPFESIHSLEGKLARLRAGLRDKVEIRPISARWAWVEHKLSQGGEAEGIAALEAWRGGGTFASWKRSFAEMDRQRE
jgi:radical SAM superfamily enzyme YgiQ (UPF0313 family)